MEVQLNRSKLLELIILVALCAGLLLFLILRPAGKLYWRSPVLKSESLGDLERITWKRGNEPEQVLVKEAGSWFIGKRKYPANETLLEDLFQQLGQPEFQDLVSRTGSFEPYELDEERMYTLSAFTTGQEEPQRILYVGKSSSSGRYSYVRLPEDNRVFTLKENISETLRKSEGELRDRLVLEFKTDDIESFRIRQGERIVEAKQVLKEKEGEETEELDWEIPSGADWTVIQVHMLINRFAKLNAKDFVDQFPKSSEENYEVQFKAKNGITYTIEIGDKPLANDQGYPAKSSSYKFPFTLDSYIVENMLKDFGFSDSETDS